MKKFLRKLLVTSIMFTLVGMSFISDMVYASNVINETLQNDVNVEPVEFSANFGGLNQAVLDINQEQLINMDIKLNKGAYLTDIKVMLKGGNYVISKSFEEISSQMQTNDNTSRVWLKGITGNQIEVDEIDVGTNVKLQIPIKFNKENTLSEEKLNSISEIKLEGTYVDDTGREQKIEKSINSKINWNAKAIEQIQQNLIRFVKYEDKTLATLEIKDGIENNLIPVKNKEISVTIPKINSQSPSKIIVSGDNIQYKNNNDTLSINRQYNPNEDGSYNWDSQDTYIVTYIYNTQSNNEVIQLQSNATVMTVNDEKLEANTGLYGFETANSVGSIIELKSEGTTELNKGYMYTSCKTESNKIDTAFTENYKINIGYADILDKIEIIEENPRFLNDQNAVLKDASNATKVRKISVNQNELKDILGDNGYIKIKDDAGNEVGIIDNSITSMEIGVNKLNLETSKPIKEGNISVDVEKSIIGNAGSEPNEINSFQKLNTVIESKGYAGQEEISSIKTSKDILLTNPSSKASLSLSTDRLSTVVENKNVVFNVVLNKTDISDMLYTNPTIKLRLPNQIEQIKVNSAKILYEDELSEGSIEVNGNEIVVKLLGNQTQYNKSSTTQGTLLRLETDLKLNNLVPSNIENVELEYTNDFSGERNIVQEKVQIVAPSGFVTTNTMTVDEAEITAVQNDEIINIDKEGNAKHVQIKADLINNLGQNANGFTVVGRIPTSGNKTIGGNNLESNINTIISSPIEINGMDDALVYYSDNVDETVDSMSWQNQPTSNTKSYKIVKNTPFLDKSMATFRYSIMVPENLGYDKQAKENYGIYYDNNAETGNSKNLIESKTVGMTTGKAPQLQVETTAIDTNQGYAINKGGNVKEGEYITYNLKVLNTGTSPINNIDVTAELQDNLSLVNYLDKGDLFRKTGEYQEDNDTKTLEQHIETLGGGQEVNVQFDAKVNQLMSDVTETLTNGEVIGVDSQGNYIDADQAKTINVNYVVNTDILEEPIATSFELKNTKGDVSAKLTSGVTGALKQSEEIIYNAEISNANFDEKENVNILFRLPKGIKFEGTESEYQTSYDERNNIVQVNMGRLSSLETKSIEIKANNTLKETQNLQTNFDVTYDGNKETIKSNTLNFINEYLNNTINATQTSSVSGEISDNEKLEYYVNITNNGTTDRVIQFRDDVPKEVNVERSTIEVDGIQVYESAVNFIDSILSIPAGKTAKVIIYATPNSVDKGKKLNVSNNPIITSEEGTDSINVSEVRIGVIGTREVEQNQNNQIQTSQEGKQESQINTLENNNKYSLRGTVWFDENKDGKKDGNEQAVPGITLKIYNSQINGFVKDENNNDLTTMTNKYGEYGFSDLAPGDYVVVALFDNLYYEITNYKVDEANDMENSDFVLAKLDNNDVGASDIINLSTSNIYNLNLGLKKREIFDLNITKDVSKVSVVGDNNNVKEYSFESNEAKVDISEEEAQKSTVLVEYNIKITNDSDVSGYAKEIVDYLPNGMAFNSELNPDWYLSSDGNLYCTSIANQKINSGESKEIKLVLVKQMNGNNIGLIRGKSEIKETYNENGLAEINAAGANHMFRSGNMAKSNVVILKQSNVKMLVVIGISIAIIVAIGFAGFEVKKHIIDKLYNYDQID